MLQVMILKEMAKKKVGEFLGKKREGVDGLLVTVGLCVLAIAIIVIFNGQLTTLVSTVLTDMSGKVATILNP